MKTQIDLNIKKAIVLESIKNKDLSNQALANKFNVSASTVRRAKESLTQQVLDDIKKANQPKKTKRVKSQSIQKSHHGYQGKTGRVSIVREACFSRDLDRKEMIAYIIAKSEEAGLRPITRQAASTMISMTLNKKKA